jgi:hypothetical protein
MASHTAPISLRVLRPGETADRALEALASHFGHGELKLDYGLGRFSAPWDDDRPPHDGVEEIVERVDPGQRHVRVLRP